MWFNPESNRDDRSSCAINFTSTLVSQPAYKLNIFSVYHFAIKPFARLYLRRRDGLNT